MNETTPASPAADTVPLLQQRWSQLVWLAVTVLLAMSLWFSATAIQPQLAAAWSLSPGQQVWLTVAVQLGFVAGALTSALLNISDRVAPPRLIAVSALAGAFCNAGIVLVSDQHGATRSGLLLAAVLRGLTGFTLAGVYPPGMKLMASWFREERGLAIGILVGALTLGSASPHLLNLLPLEQWQWSGMEPWRALMLLVSLLAVVSSLLASVTLRPGPLLATSAPFQWSYVLRLWQSEPLRRANFGYLGHMWELYAMWSAVPAFLQECFDGRPLTGGMLGFLAVGVGAVGCVWAGRLADSQGRCRTTVISLGVSGTCALVAGFLAPWPYVAAAVCLLWGFAVVADSAQFSAAISELCDVRYVGTALTVQTCTGFLLTAVSIGYVPSMRDSAGWGVTFALLALGPVFGSWHMIRLRSLPEAQRLASGRG